MLLTRESLKKTQPMYRFNVTVMGNVCVTKLRGDIDMQLSPVERLNSV